MLHFLFPDIRSCVNDTKCVVDAQCIDGLCTCNPGYHGNGINSCDGSVSITGLLCY